MHNIDRNQPEETAMRHHQALPEEIRHAMRAVAIAGTLGILFASAGIEHHEPTSPNLSQTLTIVLGPTIMLTVGLAAMYTATLFIPVIPDEPVHVRQLIQPPVNNHQRRLLNTQLLLHPRTPMARERTITCPHPTSRRP